MNIILIFLIAISLSMDACALSISYAINKIALRKAILTAIFVGIFHFFMPLLGNITGFSLFNYTLFKPKIILFIVFFCCYSGADRMIGSFFVCKILFI